MLERASHQELCGGCEGVAVGRKDELHQSAAEVGAIDALSRRGEEHLLDQLPNVRFTVRGPGATTPIELQRILEVGHVSDRGDTWLGNDDQERCTRRCA